jgi:hypothetical protein
MARSKLNKITKMHMDSMNAEPVASPDPSDDTVTAQTEADPGVKKKKFGKKLSGEDAKPKGLK